MASPYSFTASALIRRVAIALFPWISQSTRSSWRLLERNVASDAIHVLCRYLGASLAVMVIVGNVLPGFYRNKGKRVVM